MTAAIIILNYMTYWDDPHKPESYQGSESSWVSLKEIPNGGALFYPAFLKNSIGVLVEAFGQKPQRLLSCCPDLGGLPAAFGSASATFRAFPEIPLCVIIWEGDEEIRANATVLYDPSVAQLLHIESVIGLGMYLSSRLKELASVV